MSTNYKNLPTRHSATPHCPHSLDEKPHPKHHPPYCHAAGGAAAAADAKTEFDVILASFGDAKMAVIKVAKEVLGLGLKEAKEVVEGAPKAIKEGVSEAEANELKAKFEEAKANKVEQLPVDEE